MGYSFHAAAGKKEAGSRAALKTLKHKDPRSCAPPGGSRYFDRVFHLEALGSGGRGQGEKN